jgi:hypothetical protein
MGTQLNSTFASWSEDLRRDGVTFFGPRTFGLTSPSAWCDLYVAATLQSEEIKAKSDTAEFDEKYSIFE